MCEAPIWVYFSAASAENRFAVFGGHPGPASRAVETSSHGARKQLIG
jgi:hypothetical protein